MPLVATPGSQAFPRQSAGLGLAIVEAVAKAHQGELRFARTPAGGFQAAVLVPLTVRTPE